MRPVFLYISLIIATLAVSWAAIIIRLADQDPISTAFYRMFLASLFLLPVSIRGLRQSLARLNRAEIVSLMASGVVLGLHFAAWITSLSYTSISNSVIIVATQPFFIAAVEASIFRNRVSKLAFWGMAIAFIGMIIISRSDLQLGGDHLFGDFLAFIGAVCAGIYLMIGRRVRQKMDNRYYVFPVYFISAVTLFCIAIPLKSPLTGFEPSTWFWFALLALIPTVVGHTMYNYLLKYIRAHLVAITILGEPIGATIFAAFIFSEYPGPATYIGGGLILTGIVMALRPAKSETGVIETA